MNPYSPPKSPVAPSKTSSLWQKLLGSVSLLFGGLILLGGVPQFFAALLAVMNSSMLTGQSRAYSFGRMVGSLIMLSLAFLLLRYGIGKFRRPVPPQ